MHIVLMKIADPVHHEEWVKRTNNHKIPYEGKYRKGYCIPFVEEVKFYAVRIKKEAAPRFLATERALDIQNEEVMMSVFANINGGENNWKEIGTPKKLTLSLRFKKFIIRRTIRSIHWLFRQLHITHVLPEPYNENNHYLFKGHQNTFYIGGFDDVVNKDGQELL